MPRSRRNAFTLVELLVVVGIVVTLVAMLMPALQRARRQARIIACASNMRQAFFSLQMYAGDFRDHVWNYGPGPHDHVSPDGGKSNHLMWYANTSGSGYHIHHLSEGYSMNSYWRGKLIQLNYALPQALGCSIPLEDRWELSTSGNEAEPTNNPTFRQYPPFVYHGRACGNDIMVSVYAGGNIACTGWFYEKPGRETIHSPKPHKTRSEVLLHCPVWRMDLFSIGDNAQVQPHQAKPTPKYWSEYAGFGYLGHITAQNVCWNDGSVLFMDSQGKKFRYIHPDTRQFVDTPIIP